MKNPIFITYVGNIELNKYLWMHADEEPYACGMIVYC